MQEKIQVKNIFLWLKIIPFIIIFCNLNSQHVPPAQRNLLNVIMLVPLVFSVQFLQRSPSCRDKVLQPQEEYSQHSCISSFGKRVSEKVFILETSDTCSFLQILYIQTFYRSRHFVADIQE